MRIKRIPALAASVIFAFMLLISNLPPFARTAKAVTRSIDISTNTVYIDSSGIVYLNGVSTYFYLPGDILEIYSSTLGTTSKTITVLIGNTIDITLKGVNIESNTASPLDIQSGATVNLTLEGSNILTSSDSTYAAVHVPSGATLNIVGSGTIRAEVFSTTTLNQSGAAIGGDANEGAGDIVINGGTVNASIINSGTIFGSGAAIGGGGSVTGNGGAGGSITISGGAVNAGINNDNGGTLYGGGAAIGGGGSVTGNGGAGGSITINGGTVNASIYHSGSTLDGGGAAIGGGGSTSGFAGSGGSITINGGTVNASINNNGGKIDGSGAAIGGGGSIAGTSGSGGSILFTGGTTVVQGNSFGYDIGPGVCDLSGTDAVITIDGGSIQPVNGETKVVGQPTNSQGTPVYLNILTGSGANTLVTTGSISGVNMAATPNAVNYIYGINDVYTDASSLVYFWLPVYPMPTPSPSATSSSSTSSTVSTPTPTPTAEAMNEQGPGTSASWALSIGSGTPYSASVTPTPASQIENETLEEAAALDAVPQTVNTQTHMQIVLSVLCIIGIGSVIMLQKRKSSK